MLHMITKQFFLDPQSETVAESVVDEASSKMRKGMTKVKTAYREAKYEMSYAYIRPQQLTHIRKSLDRLTRHLSILGGCLKSERELFESAIQALQSQIDSDDSVSESEDNASTQNNMHHSYSEEDLNLLRTALRATNEYISGSYSNPSRQHSTNVSPHSSRPNSRAESRPHSRPQSVYTSDDDDLVDHNQKSVNSLKSFLSLPRLSIPKPKPPKKTKKQTEFHHRHLLMTYLESLRDPLMDLSLDCSNALECVCDSIASELDMDHDDDISIRKTWKSFLRHTFKIGQKPEKEENEKGIERHKGSSKCNCSQNVRLAIVQFDRKERERMHALYELNKARISKDTLDLSCTQELFLVFFFIFTMREVANELQEMTMQMDELRLYSRKASFNGKKRRHLYMPVFSQKMWQKWAKGSNHQSTRDKGGYSFGTLTTYIPKEEPKKTEAEDDYHLTKIQTNGSLKRTRSRRESSAMKKVPSATNEEKSPTMMHRRPPLGRKRRTSDDSCDVPQDIRIQVPTMDSKEETPLVEKKEKPPLLLRIRYTIWSELQYFCKYEFKFALKMASAVLVLCIPAFLPDSVDWYNGIRGQWAPMTVIAIMNPTSGGTLEASFWRIVGTLAGAFTGWAALVAGDGSPYLLGLFAVLLGKKKKRKIGGKYTLLTLFIALPSFYIHLGSTFNKVGIVCLTTYEVVALSRYANPPPGEDIAATVW